MNDILNVAQFQLILRAIFYECVNILFVLIYVHHMNVWGP